MEIGACLNRIYYLRYPGNLKIRQIHKSQHFNIPETRRFNIYIWVSHMIPKDKCVRRKSRPFLLRNHSSAWKRVLRLKPLAICPRTGFRLWTVYRVTSTPATWTPAQRRTLRPSPGGRCPTRPCGEWPDYVAHFCLYFPPQRCTAARPSRRCWILARTRRKERRD